MRDAVRARRPKTVEDALVSLVRPHLRPEDESTVKLTRDLRGARRRGHLTPAELEAVCRWKSPRAIHLVRSNDPAAVREATGRALQSRDEGRRVSALLELKGVSIPMASAVLTLVDPSRYGVIDIRVWQLLHRRRQVSGSRTGAGLRVTHWLQFLAILRRLSSRLDVPVRQVEKALFDLHRQRQRGTLYGPKR
jgi:hypothetical protein